jgi:hypothetical protein
MTTSSDRLDRIEALVEKNSQAIEKNSQAIEKNSKAIDKLTADIDRLSEDQGRDRKWEDRTWDVIKWVGGISAALSISAAIALVGLIIRLAITAE